MVSCWSALVACACAVLLLSPLLCSLLCSLLCFYFALYFTLYFALYFASYLPQPYPKPYFSESSRLGASWYVYADSVRSIAGGDTTLLTGAKLGAILYPTRLQKMQLFHLVIQRSHKGTFCRPAKSPLNGCFCIAI